MYDNDFLILSGEEVLSLLTGRETDIIDTVRQAYEQHGLGDSALPHSTFLRFPNDQRSRIIALPAYLGGQFNLAGIKWIASFPANIAQGLDRASAAIMLNSIQTGRPTALLEGSIISAKRTAASAALAARYLQADRPTTVVGLIGSGFINFEIVRFLRAACPPIRTLMVYDLSPQRAHQFGAKCRELDATIEIVIANDIGTILRECMLVSLATTAVEPHIHDLSECRPGSTLLHISLRDLAPEAVLACDNIVDDIDHVTRAQTSIHLAEQLVGNRAFIRCQLADILRGDTPARRDQSSIAVFSPFGLGVLDLAVSKLTYELACEQNKGIVIASFLPTPWLERNEGAVVQSV